MYSKMSLHRLSVEKWLSEIQFHGDCLDIGGRRSNRKPNTFDHEKTPGNWTLVNIDPDASPDYLMDFRIFNSKIDRQFDFVIVIETLEHLWEPNELWPVLADKTKSGGKVFISVPFMYSYHEQPIDVARYTHYYIKRKLEESGFSDVTVLASTSFLGTLFDLSHQYLLSKKKERLGVVGLNILTSLRKIFFRPLIRPKESKLGFSSGYFISAKRHG